MMGCRCRFGWARFTIPPCPLFIRDDEGRFSTSFECELIARDTYYALNIEMPEGDEQADMVARYVMAGYDGIELQVDLTRKVMRWSEDYGVYLDVLEFIPRSVFLVKEAPALPYFCWVEEDNQVNYELPEECKALMFATMSMITACRQSLPTATTRTMSLSRT